MDYLWSHMDYLWSYGWSDQDACCLFILQSFGLIAYIYIAHIAHIASYK